MTSAYTTTLLLPTLQTLPSRLKCSLLPPYCGAAGYRYILSPILRYNHLSVLLTVCVCVCVERERERERELYPTITLMVQNHCSIWSTNGRDAILVDGVVDSTYDLLCVICLFAIRVLDLEEWTKWIERDLNNT